MTVTACLAQNIQGHFCQLNVGHDLPHRSKHCAWFERGELPIVHDTSREAFITELHRRLDAGHRAYGDGSFERDPLSLLKEIEEELLDVCGWGYILYTRLQRMKEQLAKLQG